MPDFDARFRVFRWAHLIDLSVVSIINQTPLDAGMKSYCLCFALSILFFNSSYAEIKNGYAVGINAARVSLDVYNTLLFEQTGWTLQRKKAMQSKRMDLVKYIAYHDLTESLLKQLKAIAPDLYNEIDTIRNRNGRSTDVYVRFIPEEEAPVQAWGVTNIANTPGDANIYLSEYGESSVSVKVCTVSQALLVLAHELGHVKYIVPNLANYKAYHIMRYPPCSTQSNHVGHDADDQSGKSAVVFEKRFKASYFMRYSKNEIVRTDSPRVLVNKIRREILSRMSSGVPLAVL